MSASSSGSGPSLATNPRFGKALGSACWADGVRWPKKQAPPSHAPLLVRASASTGCRRRSELSSRDWGGLERKASCGTQSVPHPEVAGSGLVSVNTNAEACWHRVVPPALCTCLKKTGDLRCLALSAASTLCWCRREAQPWAPSAHPDAKQSFGLVADGKAMALARREASGSRAAALVIAAASSLRAPLAAAPASRQDSTPSIHRYGVTQYLSQSSSKFETITRRESLPVFLNFAEAGTRVPPSPRNLATWPVAPMGSSASSSYDTVSVGRWKKETASLSSRSALTTKSTHF